jgi:hypothetical protein
VDFGVEDDEIGIGAFGGRSSKTQSRLAGKSRDPSSDHAEEFSTAVAAICH